MQTIPTSTPPQPRVRRWSTWLLAVGLVAIVLVCLGVGAVDIGAAVLSAVVRELSNDSRKRLSQRRLVHHND